MNRYTQPSIYTILTENKNIEGVQRILDKWFNGYNIDFRQGRFNGKNEDSLAIEIIGQDEGAIELACKEIKELNEQNEVWYKKQVRQEILVV